MHDVAEIIVICPHLMGLVPIVLARTWPGRMLAITFGLVSLGLGIYFFWTVNHDPFPRIDTAIIGGLSTALISAVVTYIADKKYGVSTTIHVALLSEGTAVWRP